MIKLRWVLLLLASVPALGLLGAYTGEPWMTQVFLIALGMGIVFAALWVLLVLAGFWVPGVRTAPSVPIVVYVVALGLWLFSYPYSEQLRARTIGQEVQAVHEVTAQEIRTFRQDQGRMPFTLDELVPRYLSAIPQLSRADCQPIKYYPLADGRWELSVSFGVSHVAMRHGYWTRLVGDRPANSPDPRKAPPEETAWRLHVSS